MKCPKLYGEACSCDGYHTFDELYEHRIRLFLELCRAITVAYTIKNAYNEYKAPTPVWCSAKHSDGSMLEDWFIMGIYQDAGSQITYHLPVRFWSEACEVGTVLERAPDWDGHTSDDVLNRLKLVL